MVLRVGVANYSCGGKVFLQTDRPHLRLIVCFEHYALVKPGSYNNPETTEPRKRWKEKMVAPFEAKRSMGEA